MSKLEKRPSVLTKHDFVRRYKMGEFGNASPTWDSIRGFSLDANVWNGNWGLFFHIRNRVASGPTWYNVWRPSVCKVWEKVCLAGVDPSQLYISAMAPTEKTLFQGEVVQGLHGLDLTFTRVRKPMRDALAERCGHVSGAIVVVMLEHWLNDKSLEWLKCLLKDYPFHAIEFSVYDCCWGTIPGYNTVFWEVRLY